ncbi:DUF2163 domain-containing protein [Sneathiella chinensis]|uniref:Bacteriophage phiJL001 Gp84 C-terminal domain-containing protein n=1 Tax=Sneathiella chinensis TaxID=349750 RepID=A0ABQ5U5X9_9PROT|nr:DUF2163 domain-containing protein [Sneathiella chinensis]GLQ07507.1 hypothetical protein GCM10007924_27280 [Sneathiella chinensis]
MKEISLDLKAHMEGEVTSLATCWEVIRRDGVTLRFTDHDRDMTVAGAVYQAGQGYSRSAMKTSAGVAADDMEVSGSLSLDGLPAEALEAGLFDHAEIRLFLVNWQAPEQGTIPLRKGWIGEVRWEDGRFAAELRGLSDALRRQVGALYTPECRADLGDGKCGVNVAALEVADRVLSVRDRQGLGLEIFSGDWNGLIGGLVTFTSGLNAGRSVEIEGVDPASGEIFLFTGAPFEMAPGDEVLLTPGCDKRFETCRNRFSNSLNFQGFPHIPGTDALLEVVDD